MFKKLEASWNAHTPVYLHNGTKENIILQLTLAVVVCGAIIAYQEYKERRDFPALYENRKKSDKKK